MTIGELMRKAKVTPSGIPASTKPMKSGTAEQEQNGVTTPNEAAAAVPVRRPRPASASRTRSGGKKPRISVTTVMMPRSSSSTLGTSSRKKATASPSCEPRSSPSAVKANQSASGASANQATSQPATAPQKMGQNGTRVRRRMSAVIRGAHRWM